MSKLTNDELLEWVRFHFRYEDGLLIYRWGERAGTSVGCVDANGYLISAMNNTNYKVHRLVYLLHHGEIPPIIDHIDGVKHNNRIENLRGADCQLNSLNRRIKYRGLPRGVYKTPNKNDTYRVEGHLNKKRFYLGTFKSIQEASDAYENHVKGAIKTYMPNRGYK